MVRQPEQAPLSPAVGPGPVPVFFTITVRGPVRASLSTLIFTESLCSERRVTAVTATPSPETPAVGAGANPSPTMFSITDLPRGTAGGVTDSTRGVGFARRNTSLAPLVSLATRFVLRDVKAT